VADAEKNTEYRVQSTDYGLERHEVGAARLARSANPTSIQADATQSRPYQRQLGPHVVRSLSSMSEAREGDKGRGEKSAKVQIGLRSVQKCKSKSW